MSSAEYSTAISNFTSNNDELKEVGKKFLDQEILDKPLVYFNQMLTLLRDHSEQDIRIFASQSLLNNFSCDKKPIDEDTFTNFKNQIFNILEKETSQDCQKNICKVIGGIGGSIEEDSGEVWSNKWNEFFATLFGLLKSDNDKKLLHGLYILDEYFPYNSESFADHMTLFPPLFTKLFASTDKEILLQSVLTMASIVPCLEPNDEKKFKEMALSLLNIPLQLVKIDAPFALDAIDEIAGIAEVCKGFFAGKLTENMAFIIKQIENSDNSIDIRRGYLEVLCNIYMNNNKKLEKNLKDYLNLIFKIVSETINDPDDAWSKPLSSEAKLEGSEELAIVDRLIGASDPTKSLPILKNLLLSSLRKDWKHKYFGMMAIAQISEYLEDSNDLNDLIEFFLSLQDDEHPKVRYAVYHCFGQFADDLGMPFLQKNSGNLEKIIKGINDSVPRVVSHCLFCLGNMFEDGACQTVTVKLLENYFEQILKLITDTEQIPIIRDGALTCISGMAETAAEKYLPFYEKSVVALYKILKNADTIAPRQTRAQCIEAITLMGTAVGKEEFLKVIPDMLKIMIEILENENLSEEGSPYPEYISSGLQRMVHTLESDIGDLLDTIFPYLDKILVTLSKTCLEGDNKILDFFTYLPTRLPLKVLPYLKTWIDYGQKILNLNPMSAENIDFLGGLFQVVAKNPDKIQNKEEFQYQLSCVLDLLGKQLESEKVSDVAELMKTLLEDAGELLTEKNVKDIGNNVQGFLNQVLCDLETKTQQGGSKRRTGDEEEEDEEGDEEGGPTWDDATKLCEIIGQLFKKHPDKSKGAIKGHLQLTIPNMYKIEAGKTASLYLLDDIIESADFDDIKQEIPNIAKILLECSKSTDDGIRQAAVFGLGIFAKYSGNYFKDYCMIVLGALKAAIEVSGSGKNFDYCRDNAIAGLGRIIKHQFEILGDIGTQVGSYWVDLLPLKKDKIEGKEQHELLLDIILIKNASMVFGPNGEKMKKVLEIFGTIIGSKMSTPEVDGKIEKVLKGMMLNENMRVLLMQAGLEIDEKKKHALAKFFTKDE